MSCVCKSNYAGRITGCLFSSSRCLLFIMLADPCVNPAVAACVLDFFVGRGTALAAWFATIIRLAHSLTHSLGAGAAFSLAAVFFSVCSSIKLTLSSPALSYCSMLLSKHNCGLTTLCFLFARVLNIWCIYIFVWCYVIGVALMQLFE